MLSKIRGGAQRRLGRAFASARLYLGDAFRAMESDGVNVYPEDVLKKVFEEEGDTEEFPGHSKPEDAYG